MNLPQFDAETINSCSRGTLSYESDLRARQPAAAVWALPHGPSGDAPPYCSSGRSTARAGRLPARSVWLAAAGAAAAPHPRPGSRASKARQQHVAAGMTYGSGLLTCTRSARGGHVPAHSPPRPLLVVVAMGHRRSPLATAGKSGLLHYALGGLLQAYEI